MHYPFVKQLDQAVFRETFGAAFGKEAVIFDNLCLSQEMGQLKFEEVLRLIDNNTFMEVHPRAWLKSFEALSSSIRLAKDG